MNIDKGFLQTRVARRIVGLFFLCALLPSSALAIIAFGWVTNELDSNGKERLEEIGRLTHDAVLERLTTQHTNLVILASSLASRGNRLLGIGLDSTLARRFIAVAVHSIGSTPNIVLGSPVNPPPLDEAARRHLSFGNVWLSTGDPASDPGQARILIAAALAPPDLDAGILWAEINPVYLLTGGEALPRETELCAFDATDRPLFCSSPVVEPILERLNQEVESALAGETDRGHFEWQDDDEAYLSFYRVAFFRAWQAPPWTVVASERKADVLANMAAFGNLFIRVVFLSLLVVAWLSYVQIRKSMNPLFQLTEGTQRIAKREFGTRVQIDSGDEFEDLANSFNDMAGTLRKQFSALTAINEIDRAVLAASDIEKIIDTILSGARSVLSPDGVSVGLSSANGDRSWKLVAVASAEDEKVVRDIELSPDASEELRNHPNHLWLDGPKVERSYTDVSLFQARGIGTFLALPIFIQDRLSGVIALGYASRPALDDEDLVQARQLADQVAVALSNTRLIDELDSLNVGALTALARTIDAKSSWTAGHSERVTRMSLLIGGELGLSETDLERINRGGLLHDIGKIGIPAEVLDKPARLNRIEQQVMQDHVTVGARILEPIAAYADVIPIVLRHHEQWNGGGYPDGLAGEDIDHLARVVAVADVFDAITSERPYRHGMPLDKASALIASEAGKHFDPSIVPAFLTVMNEGRLEHAQPATPLYRPAVVAVEHT